MVSILIGMAKIVVFVSWCIFNVYTYFQLKRKMKDLAVKNNITVPFECRKCHTIYEYSYLEYLKIIKKIRNEYIVRYAWDVRRYREFKYPCEACGTKQWQRLLRTQAFLGSECQSEFRFLLIKAVIKVFAAGFLVSLCMYLLSTID